MTQKQIIVAVVLAVVLAVANAAYPRYEWRERGAQMVRIDRWTGRAVVGRFTTSGEWMTPEEAEAKRKADAAAWSGAARRR